MWHVHGSGLSWAVLLCMSSCADQGKAVSWWSQSLHQYNGDYNSVCLLADPSLLLMFSVFISPKKAYAGRILSFIELFALDMIWKQRLNWLDGKIFQAVQEWSTADDHTGSWSRWWEELQNAGTDYVSAHKAILWKLTRSSSEGDPVFHQTSCWWVQDLAIYLPYHLQLNLHVYLRLVSGKT